MLKFLKSLVLKALNCSVRGFWLFKCFCSCKLSDTFYFQIITFQNIIKISMKLAHYISMSQFEGSICPVSICIDWALELSQEAFLLPSLGGKPTVLVS